MTQALVGTLSATQTRLAEGIADAEAELVRARARCRELRETLALARAREAAAVVTPVREPDVRERQKRVRIAELTEGILASQHVAGRPIPRRWLPALISIMRLDVDRFPKIFTRNRVLQWSGGGLLAGLHLGSAQATRVATELAAHIQPGSIRVDELTGSEENLDVLARATFFAEARSHSPSRRRSTACSGSTMSAGSRCCTSRRTTPTRSIPTCRSVSACGACRAVRRPTRSRRIPP